MSEESKQPENVESEQAEAAQPEEGKVEETTLDDLRLLLEDARNKADEHWNQVLRLQAEAENARRRAERDVANARKFALEKFVSELLPVKDSLELGLSAADAQDENTAKIREGVELTLKMFAGVLEKFGVQELAPQGEPFNPELHQAMTMQETGEAEPNTVMAVMQKGYLLNERLVRPAMVVVSKAPAQDAGGQVDEKA